MSDPTQAQVKSSSTKSFVTAIVFNAAIFSIEITLFTILRPRFKAIYEPRTYQPAPSKRIAPLSSSLFAWPLSIVKSDYRDIIQANGMDAYFFVRFLRMMVKFLLPVWLLSWAVLLPVTSVNTSVPNHTGLDRLIFGNVAKNKQDRYAAHLILVYLFTGWMFYNIRKEMRHFIVKRQAHLIDPVHAKSVQANTILVTGIPAKYLSVPALLNMFKDLPGGVKQIWINRDLKDLPDFFDRRLVACGKLESGETKLMATAAKLRLEEVEAEAKGKPATGHEHDAKPVASIHSAADPERDASLTTQLVPQDKRPTHKLGFLGLFGKKVDTIDWAREEIRVCNEALEQGRREIGGPGAEARDSEDAEDGALAGSEKYPPLSSAFITFNRQIAAHLALQVLTHHEPYRMVGKYIEVAPEDVIWGNLNLNPYEQKVRILIGYAATTALILLWAIPVAFVGIVSNITALCHTYHWLSWLCDIPGPVTGIISGILPPVLLVVLTMLLPIILRLLARFEGIPKHTGVELSLMTRFFTFQVIHSFLIVTVASGIIAALPGLVKNPSGIPSLLAQNLPQAATFFLTYIILQGLSGAAGGFLQIVPLIIYYAKLYLLASTPRSIYNIRFGARGVAWGTLFPAITLIVVISLGYQIISPVINGLAFVTFLLFYLLYKYLFLYVFQMPPSSDTGGLFFPKAIQHVFVGLYVQQVCLTGLFFLAQNQHGKPGAVPEGALMVVLIIITIFFQMFISNSYGPLIYALPLSLADRTYGAVSPASEPASDPKAPATAPEGLDDARESVASSDREQMLDAPTNKNAREGPVPEEDYGFAHPAASRPQRVVWIPHDTLGLAGVEERGCREVGIEVSTRRAEMDAKGKVAIDGAPPDLVGN